MCALKDDYCQRWRRDQVKLRRFFSLSSPPPPFFFLCPSLRTLAEALSLRARRERVTMEHSYGGGSWSMIPNIQPHSNPTTPSSNQDNLYLQQQQFQQRQYYQQQQQPQPPPAPQQQQLQHHQSLASHFHLLHLVENLADAIENGTRDQHSDELVNVLNGQFEKCQQLLNSISGSINTKAMTVDGQKRKLEESEQLINQRRDLIAKYRNSVEELIKPEL